MRVYTLQENLEMYLLCQPMHMQQLVEGRQDSWLLSEGEHALQNYGYQKAQLPQQYLKKKIIKKIKTKQACYYEFLDSTWPKNEHATYFVI